MTIKEFLTKQHYVRKLRMEDKRVYTLIFGKVEEAVLMDEKDGDKMGLRIIVRDKSDGEVKAWTTTSMSTLDKLADLTTGDVFTVMKKRVKFGGKVIQGYDIEIIGKDLGAAPGDLEQKS